jgi:hypothetical protein
VIDQTAEDTTHQDVQASQTFLGTRPLSRRHPRRSPRTRALLRASRRRAETLCDQPHGAPPTAATDRGRAVVAAVAAPTAASAASVDRNWWYQKYGVAEVQAEGWNGAGVIAVIDAQINDQLRRSPTRR